VGVTVGLEVGLKVGKLVGVSEGVEVGVVVGRFVGTAVGTSVGKYEGLAVGLEVAIHRPENVHSAPCVRQRGVSTEPKNPESQVTPSQVPATTEVALPLAHTT
jgi:hypothetical protein